MYTEMKETHTHHSGGDLQEIIDTKGVHELEKQSNENSTISNDTNGHHSQISETVTVLHESSYCETASGTSIVDENGIANGEDVKHRKGGNSNQGETKFMELPENRDFYFDYDRLLRENQLLHKDGYFMGASNNFVRIFTLEGRKYWIAQATCYHRAPDWKIHFRIMRDDVPKAFNIIAKLFFERRLPFGMKAIYPPHLLQWPKHMTGREITLYIYQFYEPNDVKHIIQYSSKINNLIPSQSLSLSSSSTTSSSLSSSTTTLSLSSTLPSVTTTLPSVTTKTENVKTYVEGDDWNEDMNHPNLIYSIDKRYSISQLQKELKESFIEYEINGHPFHQFELPNDAQINGNIIEMSKKFIEEAERQLKIHGVRTSRDTAIEGDLEIGEYTSLRNEAFILIKGRRGQKVFWYPPNGCGYNAASHNDISHHFTKNLETYPKKSLSLLGGSWARSMLGSAAFIGIGIGLWYLWYRRRGK